eukprot:2292886-Pyramimonas_sp.AAC.1
MCCLVAGHGLAAQCPARSCQDVKLGEQARWIETYTSAEDRKLYGIPLIMPNEQGSAQHENLGPRP